MLKLVYNKITTSAYRGYLGFHEKEFSTVTWMFVREDTVVGKKGRDMAGIELNNAVSTIATPTQQVSSNAPAQESIRRTSEVNADTAKVKADDAAKARAEDAAKTKERHEKELENVVARSKDGDTVQVSDDGATELSESKDGIVVAESVELVDNRTEPDYEIELPEAPEIVVPETTDSFEIDGPPYGGYTAQQLETSYQQGEISAYAYNSELERRAAIREAAMGEVEETSEELGGLDAESERVEQADFAIETAVESDSKIDIEDRMEAINQTVENERTQARLTEEEGRLWDYQLRA
ncbi:MAG: hypothetical protein K5675_06445 [Lachnospiraceae bacterium]|nr:hypothetical protein [Lachnospiraceae bacterium]